MASASDYFKATFSHDMLESRQEFVDLKGLSRKGVQPLVKFSYTGKLSLSILNIEEVICAATFLQMVAAIDLCIDYLKRKLTFENSEALLSIADHLSIDSLKSYYRTYILDNFLAFSETDAFLKLDTDTLTDYLIDDKLRTPKEINLLKAALKWYEAQSSQVKKNCYSVFNGVRYCVDGWPVISFAGQNEPFKSDNSQYKDLLTYCENFMSNAETRYVIKVTIFVLKHVTGIWVKFDLL